ncbi:MAG: GDSL-type esterase/lipase family protein [Mycobacteriales bacterium]|nr:GDSL-type esterase/lipase family protein [Mycobacteriales bacterium]
MIGDDVAAVTGHGFPLQLANRTGWQITTDAVDGSGYVALGASGAPGLAARAAAAAARRPDLVILAVGLNDARDFVGDQALRDAARDAFAELTSQPTLVIGPFWPGTASRQAAAVDDLLAAEAAAAGLTYVSPTDERWFSGVASDPRASLRVFLDDDLVRPSAVGSKVLTDRIQEHLDTLASG